MLKHSRREVEGRKIEPMLEESHNSLGLEQQGNVVYGRNVMHADDLLGCNVTEHPNFLFRRFRQRLGNNKPARNLRHPRASALAIYEHK